jgi:HAMP domain-containing protein
MKDNIPPIYWTFRTAWTVLHVLIVVIAVLLLVRWGMTDGNAERLLDTAKNDLLDMQQRVARAVPWPWDS